MTVQGMSSFLLAHHTSAKKPACVGVLLSGHMRGAASDAGRRPSMEHPLCDAQNIDVTPSFAHLAGCTAAAFARKLDTEFIGLAPSARVTIQGTLVTAPELPVAP